MAERPNPDAVLAQLQANDRSGGRGKLRVYIGMAAGVGKTYGMLADAQEARKQGVDIVIGYLEPHGRAETEAVAEGLEHLPTKASEHRKISIQEFDLDAALERNPEILLVDELAHSNAPDSRHKKRWQDVEELLERGIDVWTTVNIQHLESLNDVVASITGVIVSETVPDAVINSACEVELIDIPPEDLIRRLELGKVYPPERVEGALRGFFRPRNLTALRELALRRTADQVNEQVQSLRAAEGAVEPWHTSTKLLVCIAPNALAGRVVRAAHRMATALHVGLVAVYVEGVSSGSTQANRPVYDAMRLAESLGAESVVLSGADAVAEVLEYARNNNVTTIIVAKPIRPRWHEILYGSFVEAIVRRSGDIDVHVVTGEAPKPTLRMRIASWQRNPLSYLVAVGIMAITTGTAALTDPYFAESATVLLYVLGVSVVSAVSDRYTSIFSSLLAVACFNFFFTTPRYTFTFEDPQYSFVFIVMFAVGFAVSSLAARFKEQSLTASQRERRTAALYELSRKLSSTRSRTEVARFSADQIRKVFGGEVAILIRSRKSGALFVGAPSESGFEENPNERAVASWVFEQAKPAGKGTQTLPGAEGFYLPLQTGSGCVGVLAMAKMDPPKDPGQLHLLEALANQLAIAIERTNLAKDSHESTLQRDREMLRNTLLSSVSHDLRTPLSVISGSADRLRSLKSMDAQGQELATAILEESQRLESLVRNLLDMTRLESGGLRMNLQWQAIEELLGSAILRCEQILGTRSVEVAIPENLPLVRLDGSLFEQVFVNLLENAGRHTAPETKVTIGASMTATGRMEIAIENDGPSLTEAELAVIFEKFQRGIHASTPGTGLGLAICKAIVDAHHGTIGVQPREGSGVRFVITLPVETQT